MLFEGGDVKILKKSFNVSPDLAQRMDDFIGANPGVSFTLLVNQALESWLKNPTFNFKKGEFSPEDFMDENKDLMHDLAGDPTSRALRKLGSRTK